MKRVLFIVLVLFSINAQANINKRDLLCLTTTSFNEAKGEDLLGMMLIANVIINRSHEERVCKIASKPNQFAYDVSKRIPKDMDEVLKQTVLDLYRGKYIIPKRFKEATHFHNMKARPKWAKKLVYLGAYKHHKFYKAA
jgi:spore germination cell wall hydrolase CwlJ-like protein